MYVSRFQREYVLFLYVFVVFVCDHDVFLLFLPEFFLLGGRGGGEEQNKKEE